ncbi:MAG TPA: hypothetical protein PKA12_05885 [Saprospiraceae bacterium]|nr:hypothetical protein [Saprospiraceae bacterium]
MLISGISCSDSRVLLICEGDDYIESNFYKYKQVYDNLNDSLNYWVDCQISMTRDLQNKSEYKVDSLLLFNSDSSLMFGNILLKDLHTKSSVFDYLVEVGGAKIENKWYFFLMNTIYPINRIDFKYNQYEPLSFFELGYLARLNLMSIVEFRSDSNYYASDLFFRHNFYDIMPQCTEGQLQKSCFDSLVINMSSNKYNSLLTEEEVTSFKMNNVETVKPKILDKNRNYFNKLYYTNDEKLFETKQWRLYMDKRLGI